MKTKEGHFNLQASHFISIQNFIFNKQLIQGKNQYTFVFV